MKRVARAKRPSRSARRADWIRWSEWGLAALLTGIALSLQLIFFTHAGALWRDEINSVEYAGLPSVSRIYESLGYDSFPLLSTLLLHGWAKAGLGATDQGFRVFGLLIGILFLGALWLSCRLLRAPAPLFSMALVGLNPWVVRTVASIRPYGLGMALIVATLACVWKAIESPRPRWFVLAGVLAVLSVQCMYQNAILLLALCIAGFVVSLRTSRRTAVLIILLGLLAALSLSIYSSSLAAARDWNIILRSPIPVKRLLDILSQALGSGSAAAVWAWIALAVGSLAMGVRALRSPKESRAASGPRAASGRTSLVLYGAAVLVGAAAIYLPALKATQLLTEPWYYVPLAAIIAPTLDANAWIAATSPARRIARIVLAAAIALAMALPGWRQITERWTNIDVVASVVERQASETDMIVVYPFYYGVGFQRHYKGAADWVTIPPLEDVHIHRFDLVKSAMARSGPIDSVLERMATTLRSGHRIFLLGGVPPTPEGKRPKVPPPAPTSESGWYLGPYLFSWGRQVTDLIQTHCQRADPVEVPLPAPVSRYENVPITVLSGWR